MNRKAIDKQLKRETFSTQELRGELENCIDEENKRVNVDSAKKRAVLQHMDYEGFRQMVLGANLKNLKSGAWETISSKDHHLNPTATRAAISDKDIKTDIPAHLQSVAADEDLHTPTSLMDFEKMWRKFCRTSKTRLTLIRKIPLENMKHIFCDDMDAELFLSFTKVFTELLKDGIEGFDAVEEAGFILSLYKTVSTFARFSFMTMFYSKGDKAKIANVIDQCHELTTQKEESENSQSEANSNDAETLDVVDLKAKYGIKE